MSSRKLPKHSGSSRQSINFAYLASFGLLLILGLTSFFIIKNYLQRKWDGQTRFTLVYLSPRVIVKSFDPLNREGVELDLPDDLEIESVGGRGKWRAAVISQAGEAKWAADSVAEYLGISYIGAWEDLNLWDRWQWYNKSKNVKWRQVDLDSSQFVAAQVQPDGVSILTLASNWDARAAEIFSDQSISQESLGVVVVNTLSRPGLGASVSRVVESMGLKVRSLNTSSEATERCFIKSNQELQQSVAFRKLSKVFDCSWQESSDTDFIMHIGKNYSNWKWGN